VADGIEAIKLKMLPNEDVLEAIKNAGAKIPP